MRAPLEAYELIERFAIFTVDGGLGDHEAAARLLEMHPPNRESESAWRELLRGIGDLDGKARELAEASLPPPPPLPTAESAGPPKPRRDWLMQYIGRGVPLYAQVETEDGRRYFDWRTGIWKQEAAIIRAAAELDSALEAGITLFAFKPKDGGWVALDIDRGHAAGKDGFERWRRYREEHGIEPDFLQIPTARVSTPSGGCHVYFADWSRTEKYRREPFEGVEAFGRGTDSTLTAAGSVRKGKVYELEGSLINAAAIPNWLVGLIADREPCLDEARARSEPPKKPRASFGKAAKVIAGRQGRARYTLEQLVTWGLESAAKAGLSGERNWQAFYTGLSVGSAYPLAEIEAECWRRAEFADRRGFSERELRGAIESGIRKSKYK